MADLDFISDLVRYPRESLSTEVKAWFDPSSPEGQAKIVRYPRIADPAQLSPMSLGMIYRFRRRA